MRGVSRRTRQIWRGAVFLFAMAVLIVPSAVASAQSSGNVGGRVVNPDPSNPRSKSIFIYTLEHEESKKDQILIVNPTDEPQTILLGSVDGVVTNTGDYTCRQEVEPVTDSGSWVQLAKKQITIPAGGEEKVDFLVTVPAKADVGEHNSCLTIQIVGDEGESAGGGVHLRMRQAIRMIITVPGDLKRDLSISAFTIELGTDKQDYTLTTANKGNVSADVDMRIKIVSPFGKEVANVGGEYPVVPGESLTMNRSTELRPIFGGWYKAIPSIRFDKRLGAFGTQNDTAEYETITGEAKTIFFWPTELGWLVIVGTLGLLVVIIWRTSGRVRRQRRLKKSAKTYTVRKADTIQSLAKTSKVDWKDIARLNKLAAPYSLEAGQKILLPKLGTSRKKNRAISKKG